MQPRRGTREAVGGQQNERGGRQDRKKDPEDAQAECDEPASRQQSAYETGGVQPDFRCTFLVVW